MKKGSSGKLSIKLLISSWFMLCVILFIIFPGRGSFIHFASFENWRSLGVKIGQIPAVVFFADLFLSVVGIFIFSIACTSLGAFLLKLLRAWDPPIQGSTLLPQAGSAFLVGQGIFSMLLLTLAGLYQITPLLVSIITAIGIVLGINQLMSLRFPRNKNTISQFNKNEKVILALSLGIVFLSLMYSSTWLSYDSVAVYFSDAKITALTNRIQFFTNDTFVASVYQTAIQFTALIQLFGDQTARLVSWISGIVIILFSLALGEQAGISPKVRLIHFSMIVTSTALLDLMGDGKVDLTSSAPAIAAVYWMHVESKESSHNTPLLVLIGFLAGLAIISRPYNAVLLGLFTVFFYLQKTQPDTKFSQPQLKRLVLTAFWISIGMIGPGLYHLVANSILLGDPLAPFSNASRLDPAKWQWTFDPQQLFFIRLFYPFVVTFLNSPQSLGSISPVFIGVLPAIFLQSIRKSIFLPRDLRHLLVAAVLTLSVWISAYFTVVEIRYVLFLWMILYIPASEIMVAILESKDSALRNFAYLALVGLLVFINIRTVYISLASYAPVIKGGDPQCNKNGFCNYLIAINEQASPGDRVLTLSAYRYYLRNDLFVCSTKHDEYSRLQVAEKTGSDAFWLEVYRQGYKYIAYETEYATRHLFIDLTPESTTLPAWLTLKALNANPDGLPIAYEIIVNKPPISSKWACQENSSGIWDVQSVDN